MLLWAGALSSYEGTLLASLDLGSSHHCLQNETVEQLNGLDF